MGFKIFRPVVYAGSGAVGDMWTALPFFNPYTSAGVLCTKLGLTPLTATVMVVNPVTGVSTTVQCGTTAANMLHFVAGQGVKIRQPNVTGAPTNLILVGSHNDLSQMIIPETNRGPSGTLWYAVPYHATANTAADLCSQLGLTSTGMPRARITRVDPVTGFFTNGDCGLASATNLTLVLGEAVRITEPNAPIYFTPKHY